GVGGSLRADHDARTFQAFGEAGYRIDTRVAAFEPFINLAYVDLKADGFREAGGAAALQGDGGSTDTVFSTLCLRASTGFKIGAASATARGTLGWRHAYGDVLPSATHAFAGGDAFTVAGVPIARNSAVLEAAVDVRASDAVTL